MNNIWKASVDELRQLALTVIGPFPKQNLGDVTVVCHTSNQAHLLPLVIESAKAVTDKIIILDDCSLDETAKIATDSGCRLYNIPEGWIYTHGFGELIKRSVSLVDSGYYLQVDTGEKLWVNPSKVIPPIGDYCWTLRINMQWSNHRCRQPMLNRIIRAGAPISMPALIHGSPREAQIHAGRLAHLQVAIVHDNPSGQKDSEYYLDRKNRLYFKLLKKGYHQRKLENSFWYRQYEKDKDYYNRMLREAESRIGVLQETTEDIRLVQQGDW